MAVYLRVCSRNSFEDVVVMDGTWRANRPVIYIYGSLLLAEEVISNIWKGWISPLRDRYIDFNL